MVNTGQTLIKLRSGVEIVVAPLSPYARERLWSDAFAHYPYPDPVTYEVVLEGQIDLAGKPARLPADENPAYAEICRGIDKLRQSRLENQTLRMCVQSEHEEKLITQYQHALKMMREGNFPDLPEDDFIAILRCFLTNTLEIARIFAVISQVLELTEEEIRDGFGFFRLHISGNTTARSDHP
jgi:hypothetical protein